MATKGWNNCKSMLNDTDRIDLNKNLDSILQNLKSKGLI